MMAPNQNDVHGTGNVRTFSFVYSIHFDQAGVDWIHHNDRPR